MCIVNPFIYYFFKSQKSNLSLENKNLKWGEISLWNKCFFFYQIHVGQLLVPLEILMSKIYLKYIPYSQFWALQGDYEHEIFQPCFLFHRKCFTNRRENKAQITLIIHHNEKNQRIYFWCAAKDNWASQISEVALRKELEQWKFPFPPSGQ